jgi:hypothetical protein
MKTLGKIAAVIASLFFLGWMMDKHPYILLAAFLLVEIYYWFIYFPRAWKDGSNREINDIKFLANEIKQPHWPW